MELISAIATAQGPGGVAIVRMSGDGALCVAKAMFSAKGEYAPNVMRAGTIDCGDFSDFGMCVYFQAPHSFTGEDIVEFHCHGGTQIARGVLRRTLSLGARLALPGEFTRRAFLNGKLSLSAAEGLGEMISAQSASQVRAGFLLYHEKLTEEVSKIQKEMLEALAATDAELDFPEEDLSEETRGQCLEKIQSALQETAALLKQYGAGKKIKSGVTAAICGRPNAGKSSLFNALLGYDRAIVSSSAGTTRDILEGEIELNGVLFRLIDTAGVRESIDEVEREGVRRAENALKAADLIIYLKEGNDKIVLPDSVPVVTVGAKCDLAPKEGTDVNVSSVTGEGIGRLKELIYERGFGGGNEGAFLLEQRHFEAVRSAREALLSAFEGAKGGEPSELYAEDLKKAYSELGKISGERVEESVVEEIFSKFCVGK